MKKSSIKDISDSALLRNNGLSIQSELCDFCGACVAVCPVDCIELKESEITIDSEICTYCLICVHACPIHIIIEMGSRG